jgi:AraC family transcriptional regulator, alkane utilization regulator
VPYEAAEQFGIFGQLAQLNFGMPPMHYVANWRMQVATQKLRNTSASLAPVADLVGYSSEAAFSRAFKKAFGTAPATWRRSNR